MIEQAARLVFLHDTLLAGRRRVHLVLLGLHSLLPHELASSLLFRCPLSRALLSGRHRHAHEISLGAEETFFVLLCVRVSGEDLLAVHLQGLFESVLTEDHLLVQCQ